MYVLCRYYTYSYRKFLFHIEILIIISKSNFSYKQANNETKCLYLLKKMQLCFYKLHFPHFFLFVFFFYAMDRNETTFCYVCFTINKQKI